MYVALSIQIEKRKVLQTLKELLSKWSVENYDEIEKNPPHFPDIAVQVDSNVSNFPTYINFLWFLGVPPPEVFIELARRLSLHFKCDAVCEAGNFAPQESKDSPYWDIVWSGGQAFLADDAEWDLNEGGKIRIHHPIEVPIADLEETVEQWLSAPNKKPEPE